jgi:hypothetical protein
MGDGAHIALKVASLCLKAIIIRANRAGLPPNGQLRLRS